MSAADEWDEGRIHAYVDGKLDAFTAARLEAACRQDAILDARVEKQRRLRMRLKASFDAVLDEPVPARLLQAVTSAPSATVTPIRATRPRARIQPIWLGALAASVVIGIAVGWLAPRESGPFAAGSHGLVATGYLEAALTQALSSDTPATSGVQVTLSFRASDGTYCRGFSLTNGSDGLACRTTEGWHIEVTGKTAPRTGQDYRQAASALSGAVLAAIEDRQSGDTLDAAQERQARDSGWRAPGKAAD